jgi:uncharacterized protein
MSSSTAAARTLRARAGTLRARVIGSLLCAFALSTGVAHAAQDGYAYTNRLIDSNNPYLLQHAHNPVDWYPWGPEALEKARRENRPIFLSIGYSTCYWCHVAERTLFSDPQIARLMNEWFVNVKVDREERPDVDAVYMLATQLITSGAGGWPNNLFLTPDLEPFYAGGYFPPEDDEMGRPGFPSVLKALHEEWTQNPQRARQRASGVVEVLRRVQAGTAQNARDPFDPARWLEDARASVLKQFDAKDGGLGTARQGTKFPQSPILDLMLSDYRHSRDARALEFVTVTLDAMAYGGLYDQLGGGFHRYSTERTWSLPHFEKMLYDNAQLLALYARAWQLTGKPQYKRIALGVRDYLRLRMMSADGGFYTAEDAAVAGEEGASYLWTPGEIAAVLGGDAGAFLEVYALTPLPEQADPLDPEAARGVLRVRAVPRAEKRLAELDAARRRLLAARDTRQQPARDEKLLVGLNGLAIDGFVASSTAFRDRGDLAIARFAAERMWTLAWNPDRGLLGHQVFQGRAQGEGFLDDYALLGRSFLSLHRASGEKIWLQRARTLADALLQRFDADGDGVLASTADSAMLILAPLEQGDQPYPSGTSAAVDLLSRLGRAGGGTRYAQAAAHISRNVRGRPEQWPTLLAAVSTQASASSPRLAPANAAAGASEPGQTAKHVRASGTTRSGPEHDEIVVTLEIERGFHVNANPASFDFLIPTSVSFGALRPLEVRYPAAQALKSSFAPDTLSVYEGTVQISARLQRGALDELHALKASVTAQACTDTVCLAPAQIPLTIRVAERR